MNYSLIVYNEDREVTDVISFTSVTQFNESYTSEITENIVEYGFSVSDHITTKAPDISLEGMVSDYTIQNADLQLDWNGTDFTTSLEQQGGSQVDYNLAVKRSLISIVKERKVFTLVITRDNNFFGTVDEKSSSMLSSAVDIFTNCLMPLLSFPVKDGVSGAFFFSMSIKQVRVAITSTTNFDASGTPLVVPVVAKATTGTASTLSGNEDENGKNVGDKDSANTDENSKKRDRAKMIESAKNRSQVCKIYDYNQEIVNATGNLPSGSAINTASVNQKALSMGKASAGCS